MHVYLYYLGTKQSFIHTTLKLIIHSSPLSSPSHSLFLSIKPQNEQSQFQEGSHLAMIGIAVNPASIASHPESFDVIFMQR